jgi:hypothetical protein
LRIRKLRLLADSIQSKHGNEMRNDLISLIPRPRQLDLHGRPHGGYQERSTRHALHLPACCGIASAPFAAGDPACILIAETPAHVTGIDPTGLLDMDLWRKRFTGDEWKAFFQEGFKTRPRMKSFDAPRERAARWEVKSLSHTSKR